MPQKPKNKAQQPKVEKIISYRATSPDGKHQANGSTEKEALERLEWEMNYKTEQ